MSDEQKGVPEVSTVPLTNSRGEIREYETVASRVRRFRFENSDWSILPEIILIDEDVVRMKVSIGFHTADTKRFIPIAIGHAEEYRADGEFNATSALENCETSALGRALAFAGYGSADSIASAEEVMGAKKKKAAMDQAEPGALVLLQNAAKKGLTELQIAWDKDLKMTDRKACAKYMPALKRQAADIDASRQS